MTLDGEYVARFELAVGQKGIGFTEGGKRGAVLGDRIESFAALHSVAHGMRWRRETSRIVSDAPRSGLRRTRPGHRVAARINAQPGSVTNLVSADVVPALQLRPLHRTGRRSLRASRPDARDSAPGAPAAGASAHSARSPRERLHLQMIRILERGTVTR